MIMIKYKINQTVFSIEDDKNVVVVGTKKDFSGKSLKYILSSGRQVNESDLLEAREKRSSFKSKKYSE